MKQPIRAGAAVPALFLLLLACVALSVHGAADVPAGATATASASSSASVSSDGGAAKAAAAAKASATSQGQIKEGSELEQPKPTADLPGLKRNPEAESAWWAFVNKCANNRYDPKVTTPGECGTLSGDLCLRKDVKCSAKTTDILDPAGSGAVIATGDNLQQKLCYVGGACAQA